MLHDTSYRCMMGASFYLGSQYSGGLPLHPHSNLPMSMFLLVLGAVDQKHMDHSIIRQS